MLFRSVSQSRYKSLVSVTFVGDLQVVLPMLSDIILRSTTVFGGAPFRFKKCTALSSAATGAAGGSAVGGIPGALVGGALGVASSLLGGLFGSHNTNKNNKMNYLIMQEQNRFNAEEAKKNREWQELMYRMFGTSSAKANDMRSAGLNALLGDCYRDWETDRKSVV